MTLGSSGACLRIPFLTKEDLKRGQPEAPLGRTRNPQVPEASLLYRIKKVKIKVNLRFPKDDPRILRCVPEDPFLD